MKPIPKHSVRLVAACVAFTAVFPAHAAPLALRQLPPQAVVPPSPNILVTLDDSGSMASTVAFDVRQNYSVPLGPTGVPIATQTTPPMAYQDGYLLVSPLPAPIDVSSVPRYPTLGSAEAKQKFVNWYGFYRTRNMAMKAAVMSAFNPTVVPDDQFRIAWQGLTETCHTGFPASSLKCPSNNAMWTLSDSVAGRTHRTNFFNWVRSVPPGSGTPLRDAAHRAGQYFLTSSLNVGT